VTARRHSFSVPIKAIQTKRPSDRMRGRYHIGLITTIAVFMLGAGLWVRSGPETAVHDPVVEQAPIAKTTAIVAYFPALHINQAKLAEEPLAAY
jgi:hypothetical protein